MPLLSEETKWEKLAKKTQQIFKKTIFPYYKRLIAIYLLAKHNTVK